jgi:hypothetical protein
MAWINLVAERPRTRERAIRAVDRLRDNPEMTSLGPSPPLTALLAGEPRLFGEAVESSRAAFTSLVDMPDKGLMTEIDLPDVLGLSVAFHIHGESQEEVWLRIAGYKSPKSARLCALQDLAAELAGVHKPRRTKKQSGLGLPRRPSQIYSGLKAWNLRHLMEVVLAPDHDLWAGDLKIFALPLGLLLHRSLQEEGLEVAVEDIFRLGGYPERHREVLYERDVARPAWQTGPVPGDKSTWYGFDAVEIAEGELRVYHYLTLKWKAPLIFDDELNAFEFLDQLDQSWSFVRESVDENDRERIDSLRNQGKERHIVVRDVTEAPLVKGHLERAAEHYGINLDAKDVLEV